MKTTEELYSFFLDHPLITTDSRTVLPGSIFFGLKGEIYDGNRFAAQALAKGAGLAVVDDPETVKGKNYLLVRDSLATLQELAAFHRTCLNANIIAITGSNGKTTTKELLGRMLSTTFRTVSTQGNLNNHIGVPLTILSMNPLTELAVVEMGANHPGEIGALCGIAQPDFGIVTNIGKAHLEGFGSFEGVIRAKSELYEHLRTFGGSAWVNGDDRLLLELSAGISRRTYGSSSRCDCRGKIVTSLPFLEISWLHDGMEMKINTKLFGDYNFSNIMAAICAADQLGVSQEKISEAIAGYVPSNNRSQVVETGRNTLILDAYNANPSSMKAALEQFSRLKSEKKMVIAGDMLELGPSGPDEHRTLLEFIAGLGIDKVILVGPVLSGLNTNERFISFEDAGKALKWILEQGIEGFTILLKGSRKIGLESLATAL